MYSVLVNPQAGNGRASKAVKKVSKYLKSQNVEFLVYFSENAQDLVTVTKKLCKDGEREFIVIGGDGTLNHFLNGVTDPSKTNFGIIPAGKHNHFASHLNIPQNPIDAVKNILEHPTIKIDYLKCNQYRALNLISCGAVETAEKRFLDQTDKPKLSRKAMLKSTLKAFDGINASVESDNLNQKDKLYDALAICNGGFYGDNIYISPLSNMHDGLANIITINHSKTTSTAQNYVHVKRGKHIYSNPSSNSWSSFANISSKHPLSVMMDGEMYNMENMEINVIPNGLNIYTKK